MTTSWLLMDGFLMKEIFAEMRPKEAIKCKYTYYNYNMFSLGMKNVPKLTCLNTKATSTVTSLMPCFHIHPHLNTFQPRNLSFAPGSVSLGQVEPQHKWTPQVGLDYRDSPADLIAIRYILAMILV